MTDPRERGLERRALEPGAPGAQELDHFRPDDVHEPAGRAAASGELGDPADAVDLAAARLGLQEAASHPDHQLADDEPDGEEDERRLEVGAVRDRERVVGLREEEVEAERRYRGGDDTAAPPPENRCGEDREHEHERGVHRAELPTEGDHHA